MSKGNKAVRLSPEEEKFIRALRFSGLTPQDVDDILSAWSEEYADTILYNKICLLNNRMKKEK